MTLAHWIDLLTPIGGVLAFCYLVFARTGR